MTSRKQFLIFNISVIKLCLLWSNHPEEKYSLSRFGLDSLLLMSLMPCTIPIMVDFVSELNDGAPNITSVVEDMIALNCIFGMIYLVVCFIVNRKEINDLLIKINGFQKYGNWNEVEEVDQRVNLFSKVFLFYGILGNFVYMLMPQLSVKKCHQRRNDNTLDDDRVPCGLVVRSKFPFKFDSSPVFEMVFVHQIYTCTMVTIVVLVLTMLLCGVLMHIVHQLRSLRRCIRMLKKKYSPDKMLEPLLYCIHYHVDICEYCEATADAFSAMLLFYMTITSLLVSVLCFEIIMVEAFEESLRFSFHLLGWFIILLSICYYGQQLIDESLGLSEDIYSIDWFDASLGIQEKIHLMLMRSQKSLKLRAGGLHVISLPAFLGILRSSYSFFTLLLKFKN